MTPTMAPPTSQYYSVADVLSVAKIHPFYASNILYPPSTQTITETITHSETDHTSHPSQQLTLLHAQPLLRKPHLYTTIRRLINDPNPLNTYRHGIYTSTTGGGGSTSQPLFFGTDVHENRQQRHLFGRFLAATGVISPGDWVVTVHSSGGLYRALDLTLETMENAGASMLPLGHLAPPAKVVQTLIDYHANVLSGDGSQIVALAHFISQMPAGGQREATLTGAQAGYIRGVFGDGVGIYSVMGSAEAGPYAISNPALTEGMEGDAEGGYVDFVYDTRAVVFEIFPVESGSSTEQDGDDDSISDLPPPKPLPDGEVGMIVQTSLARLRNPLVRYVTGDIGSLHWLSEQARIRVGEEDWPYLRVLRHRGRDGRFSLEWSGEYFEFDKLAALMNDGELGVIKWQVILDRMETRPTEAMLEVRVLLGGLLSQDSDEDGSRGGLVRKRICKFFVVHENNEDRFQLRFVDSLEGFELSETGRKVVRFVDRFHR